MKYNYLYFVFTLLLISIFLTTENEIENGVYQITNLEGNLNLKLINSTLYFSSKENKNTIDKYRIYQKEYKKENEYDSYNEDSQIYYYIEEKDSKKKLYFDESTEAVLTSEIINPKDDDLFLWEIKSMNYRNNLHYYEIKTKTKNKYISYEESKKELSKIYCESSWNSLAFDRKTKFRLIKLYKENNNMNIQSTLLEKEPIDVVIKYIDLNDTSLDRHEFDQIEKDIHNNELKYSLRSILQNIPWVRKIFIIMPNEKIPFLKEKSEIKDKIIYIKDSDLLGFDSSSPPTFQFNLHKLKNNDLSENFILMDDDYFIGQPLSKSDFFYEENEKIYPYLISTEYSELDDEDELKNQYIKFLSKINDINYHSEEGFLFRKISTLSFLYQIFDNKKDSKTLIEVGYTHNAIPLKISDVEEIYEYIKDKYKYSDECLKGKKRNIRSLQPQILFMNYARNKYDRLVKELSWKYYDLSDVGKVNLDSKLFVINVENKEYYPLRFKTEEELLNDLFPNPSIYEKEYINKNENIDINKNLNNETDINESKKENEEDKEKVKDSTYRNIDLNEFFSRIQNMFKKSDDKNVDNNKNIKEKENKEKEDEEKTKKEEEEEKVEPKKEEKETEKKEEKVEPKKEEKKQKLKKKKMRMR